MHQQREGSPSARKHPRILVNYHRRIQPDALTRSCLHAPSLSDYQPSSLPLFRTLRGCRRSNESGLPLGRCQHKLRHCSSGITRLSTTPSTFFLSCSPRRPRLCNYRNSWYSLTRKNLTVCRTVPGLDSFMEFVSVDFTLVGNLISLDR